MMDRRVKGRGPRITEKELQRMLELYHEGKSFKQIGEAVERHWQTVTKYVRQALAAGSAEELRREALKTALTSHYRQLIDFLGDLQEQFPIPSSQAVSGGVIQDHFQPDRLSVRDRLLYRALRDVHAKDSPLWGQIDEWLQTAEDYREACHQLAQCIQKAIDDAARDLARVSFEQGFAENLFKHGLMVAFGRAGYEPSYLNVHEGNNRWELWRGQAQRLAFASSRESAEQAQGLFFGLAREMATWDEIEDVGELYRNLSTLTGKIEENAEILKLRGTFPGRCDVCPI